jgi:hypothetical protein
MADTLQQYLGEFYVGTTLDSFSIGGYAVTLTHGYYYLCGWTSEGTAQFLEHMQAQIRAISGTPYPSATCTYSQSTGLVTIATGGAAATITWTDTALQALLGFTGTQSGAASYTGTNQPRYVWRPSDGLTEYPTDLSRWWGEESTTIGVRAPTGATHSVEGELLYRGKYRYTLLTEADTIITSTSVWQPFQQFWEDVIHKGRGIRCYPDRTLNTSTDVKAARYCGERVGKFEEWAERYLESYNGLWNLTLELCKEVTA